MAASSGAILSKPGSHFGALICEIEEVVGTGVYSAIMIKIYFALRFPAILQE